MPGGIPVAEGGHNYGTLNAFMVRGRTQITETAHDPIYGSSSHRVYREQYVVDASAAKAKAQFKLIYPGSTDIRASFIKRLLE